MPAEWPTHQQVDCTQPAPGVFLQKPPDPTVFQAIPVKGYPTRSLSICLSLSVAGSQFPSVSASQFLNQSQSLSFSICLSLSASVKGYTDSHCQLIEASVIDFACCRLFSHILPNYRLPHSQQCSKQSQSTGDVCAALALFPALPQCSAPPVNRVTLFRRLSFSVSVSPPVSC